MTNNNALSNKEIIEFYNQLGDAESSNRFLLNDFNLHHLPFPDMCTNTLYMYLMAMCNTLFKWAKNILVNNTTEKITLNMRAKAVCFHYIVSPRKPENINRISVFEHFIKLNVFETN